MAKKYLDYDGVLYFWQKIKAAFVTAVSYDSSSRKLQVTKNGTTSDVVTLSKVASSNSYSDLDNKPTIPSAGTGSNYPAMDGTKALGSNAGYARVDHVHPTDTTRAPLASPAFTGTPTAPTAATGTATTQIATTEFVSNTVGAMTSGVADVQVDGSSIVESGIAKIRKYPVLNDASNPGLFRLGGTTTRDSDTDTYSASVLYYVNSATSSNPQSVEIARTTLATTAGRGLMSSADKSKLDSLTVTNGVIDASNLPSYVDDVIEAYARSGQTALSSTWLATGSASGTVITPEAGKIYVLMADSGDYAANTQFRWGGTAYVKMADGGVSSITNAEIDTIVAS
jgi:hypothetical protein